MQGFRQRTEWLLTVGTVAATVATAAALAPATAASAVPQTCFSRQYQYHTKLQCNVLLEQKGKGIAGMVNQRDIISFLFVTSGAAPGGGELLIKVGTGHRRHLGGDPREVNWQ